MSRRLPQPPEACQSCRGPCCVGRVVYLNSLDVYRIASTIGLDWSDFAFAHPAVDSGFLVDNELGRITHRVRLRHAYGGTCLLAVNTPEGTLRCGIATLKPSACRIYPYNVQLFAQQPYQVAIGNDAACPSFGVRWFQQSVDALGDEVDVAVADAALAMRVEARWNELVEGSSASFTVADHVRWAWEVYRRIGLPPAGTPEDRATWQVAAYRAVRELDLSLLPSSTEAA